MERKAQVFPRSAAANDHGIADRGNSGLTNEEYFAARAPDVPNWFQPECDVYYSFINGLDDKQSMATLEKRFFEWRLYYARKMCELL